MYQTNSLLKLPHLSRCELWVVNSKLEKPKEDLMNLCCRVLRSLALRTQGDTVRNTLQDPVSADADPASEKIGPATSVASGKQNLQPP